jgi:branched-chain amino acid transport system substrate-binding protein
VLTAPFIRPAQAQDPIKIGEASLRSHADYGRQIQMGARFAAEDINAKSGIMGRKVEILYRDDELNNEVALKNARFFKAQGVNFMVGTDSAAFAWRSARCCPSST